MKCIKETGYKLSDILKTVEKLKENEITVNLKVEHLRRVDVK